MWPRHIIWRAAVGKIKRERNYDLFRLFKVTFRLFAIDNLWFPSRCCVSVPFFGFVLHLPPSLTCRNKRHKIVEHEPNISLPRLPFALFPLSIREKMKIDMQNRSNVHFHAFLMAKVDVDELDRVATFLPILFLLDSEDKKWLFSFIFRSPSFWKSKAIYNPWGTLENCRT